MRCVNLAAYFVCLKRVTCESWCFSQTDIPLLYTKTICNHITHFAIIFIPFWWLEKARLYNMTRITQHRHFKACGVTLHEGT